MSELIDIQIGDETLSGAITRYAIGLSYKSDPTDFECRFMDRCIDILLLLNDPSHVRDMAIYRRRLREFDERKPIA